MSKSGPATSGFSLVEVIIAMFILGLIAVALLPALYNGIRYSSEQSAVATATRHLNALIEEMRDNPDCLRTTGPPANTPLVPNAAAFATAQAALNGVAFTDGKGSPIRVDAYAGTPVNPASTPNFTCTQGGLVDVYLRAVDASGNTIASVTAKIYMGT